MQYFRLALLFTSLASAHEVSREPHEPHEPHQPVCNTAAVLACIEENRQAQAAAAANLVAALQKKEAVGLEREKARNDMNRNAAALEKLQEQAAILSEEIEFSQAQEPGRAPEILPEFLSAETFFSLDPLERDWLGRLPADRIALLNQELTKANEEQEKLKPVFAKIREDFQKLTNDFAACEKEEATFRSAESQHAFMCVQGCRSNVCPPREP